MPRIGARARAAPIPPGAPRVDPKSRPTPGTYAPKRRTVRSCSSPSKGRVHRSTGRAVARAVASLPIVELRLDPVNVARRLGHADPAMTLRTYSDELARERDADVTRHELAERFGGLLAPS